MRSSLRSRRAAAAITAMLGLSGFAMSSGDWARSPLDAYTPIKEMAEGPLEPLGYFVGTWEVEATWSWGATLRARNTYAIGPGGRSLTARTIVSDNGELPYERYLTVFTHDPDTSFRLENRTLLNAYGFNADGSVVIVDSTLIVTDGGGVAVRSLWITPEGVEINQVAERIDDDRYRWIVDIKQPGNPDAQRVMDTEYVRVKP